MKLGGGKTAVIKSTVFEGNNGALTTANAVNMAPHTKHIGMKYHLFKHHCGDGSGITIFKVDTLMKKADIFTRLMSP